MRKEKENKKRRKLLPAMLAVALAAVMIVPMGSTIALAEEYSLKVSVANEDFTKEDPDLQNVTLRVYKLADLTEESSKYSWDLAEAFAAADTKGELASALTDASTPGIYSSEEKTALNGKYQELAAQATKLIIDNEMTTTVTTTFGTAKEIAENGLYIVVPVLGDKIDRDDAGNVTVTTDDWIYTFNPLIMSVPTKKASTTDGSIGTAAEYGDWISAEASLLDPSLITEDVLVAAKIDRKPNVGSIQIEKALDLREGKAEAATFVFSVKATKNGDTVYDNMVSISHPNPTPVVIDNLPVGSTVTIKEEYTSPSYRYVSGIPADGLVVDAEPDDTEAGITQIVTVSNTYNENHYHGGGGIENQYANTETEAGKSWKLIGRIINGIKSVTSEAEE